MKKSFLIKYGQSQRIIVVKETDNFVSIIKDQLGIDADTEIILQNFDKEWDAWIDVTEFLQVPNRTMLRCIHSLPFSNPSTSPVTLNDSVNTDSDSTVIIESLCSTPTSSEELEAFPQQVINLKQKFPYPFPIKDERFSSNLQEALLSKKHLNWSQRKELLDVLSNEIQQYTDIPNKEQRQQVSAALVSKYPYLKEKLGSGTDGWQERIRDKMKNVRRNKRCSVGAPKRGLSVASDDVCRLLLTKKACRGEVNWTPELPDGEDEQTLTKHQNDMKKEWKKAVPDLQFIKKRMEVTYPQRRLFINSNPPVVEIKELYPCLFTMDEIENEFKRLMDTNLYDTFDCSLKKVAPNILSLAKASKKTNDQMWKTFMSLESSKHNASVEQMAVNQATAALIILPHLLGNHQELVLKEYEDECTRDFIVETAETPQPFVAIVGTPQEPKCCYVVAEKTIVMDMPSVITAVSAAFGIYYACNLEFPKKALETYVFIQKFLLNIRDKLKTPRRVITLSENLRK